MCPCHSLVQTVTYKTHILGKKMCQVQSGQNFESNSLASITNPREPERSRRSTVLYGLRLTQIFPQAHPRSTLIQHPRLLSMTCSNCGGDGHNRRSCVSSVGGGKGQPKKKAGHRKPPGQRNFAWCLPGMRPVRNGDGSIGMEPEPQKVRKCHPLARKEVFLKLVDGDLCRRAPPDHSQGGLTRSAAAQRNARVCLWLCCSTLGASESVWREQARSIFSACSSAPPPLLSCLGRPHRRPYAAAAAATGSATGPHRLRPRGAHTCRAIVTWTGHMVRTVPLAGGNCSL